MERVTRINCPHCGTTLELDDDYFRELAGNMYLCPNCNQFIPMPRLCPQCQHECEPSAAFCPACGTDLSGKKPLKLKSQQQAAPDPSALNSRYRCPYCGNVLALGTRVCAICRTDLRTGKPIGQADKRAPEKEDGCLMSAASLCALLVPVVGIVLGIIIIVRARQIGQGVLILIVSVIMLGFWAAFWPSFWGAFVSAL